MCSLRFENNLLTIEGVRFASISKKTPLSKLSFALVSLALPLLVVSVNGTLGEDKMRGFKGECAHFSSNKCPIYTHDRASAKFITNSHETDYRVI